MTFTIYFGLVALANIFLGYFLAMKLGLVVPGVAGAAGGPDRESDWEESQPETESDKE